MSNPISASLREALLAERTGEALLMLMIVEHEDWEEPIRLTTDRVATVSGGETFLPNGFDVTLPIDGDGVPRVQIVIDAVDRSVSLPLQQLLTTPTVTVQLVRASNTNYVELEWPELEVLSQADTITKIALEVGVDDLLQEGFPIQKFNRALFPGVRRQ